MEYWVVLPGWVILFPTRCVEWFHWK